MTSHVRKFMFLVVILAAVPAMAGVPNVITHRGVIAVHGQPFNGAGHFRFALVDRGTGDYLWKNDGCIPEICPEHPALPVTLTVANGVYHVRLGDGVAHDDDGNPSTPSEVMRPIPRAVFNEHDEVALRIWFDDGAHGLHQLTPDQALTSSPYAQRLPNVFVDEATGHVGIGTTTPGNKLSVAGSADFSGNVGIATSTPSNALSVEGDADVSGRLGLGTPSPLNELDVNGSAVVGSSYAGTTSSPPNGLLVEGNVGIGAPAPHSNVKMQVSGSQTTYDAGLGGGGYIVIEDPDPARGAQLAIDNNEILARDSISGESSTLFINNDGGTVAFGGTVGIGTTTPTEKLDVVGKTRTSSIDVVGTTRTSRIEVTEASGFGLVPPGAIIPFAGTTPPPGWLLCNGTAISRTEYSALFDAIGTAWGYGDGSTTFHLPDLRARFLRGVAHGSSRDPDRSSRAFSATGGNTGDTVGSCQSDQYKSHFHETLPFDGSGAHDDVGKFTSGGSGGTQPIDQVLTTDSRGGNETRPENAYVEWIIKY